MAGNWRKVCVALDLDPTGTTMNTIEQQFPNKPEDCSIEMFKKWLTKKSASWMSLIKVPKCSGEDTLADRVKLIHHKRYGSA